MRTVDWRPPAAGRGRAEQEDVWSAVGRGLVGAAGVAGFVEIRGQGLMLGIELDRPGR